MGNPLNVTLTRRQLLKTGSWLAVGFAFAGPIAQALAATQGVAKPKNFKMVDAWLAIDRSGNVTAYTGKVDLGTGIETALAQIVADELDVPFNSVTIVQGDTQLTPDQGPTWGSLSIQAGGAQMRKAAACARRAILSLAAKKIGVAEHALKIENGVIVGGGKRLKFQDLAQDNMLDVAFDDTVQVKRPDAYQIVGKSVARVDIPGKVTGEFTYMQDFKLPGMLHARVIRPAAIAAKLESMDDSAARKMPGFITTVVRGNFVGVVAETEWGAIKASQAVKCKWSDWAGLPAMSQVYEDVKKTAIKQTVTAKNVGDAPGIIKSAAKSLKATYEYPIQTHGSIGPSCSVANVSKDFAQIWSASQSTHWLQRQIAKMLGFKNEQVHIVYLEGAGCYGRNGHEDATADAVLLSQALGKPVRVQWMRADEHGWDPKAPPYVADLEGTLDDTGHVRAWNFVTWLPARIGGMADVPLLADSLEHGDAGYQTADTMNAGSMENDAEPPYDFPNVLATIHRLETTPFRPAWLRGPGRLQNTYANECFMNELAVAAGVDPVAFRLNHLKDDRGAQCIQACVKQANWLSRVSPQKDTGGDMLKGRGFAYVFYDNSRTYVAAICELEINRATSEVRVTRFVVAHDCGLMINPDGVKAQVEGNIVQTLSRTLLEEVKWDSSHVTSLDWGSYPILTFPDVPKIEIVLINRPDQPAWGAGEPTCAVIAPAVANAIFDATGKHIRTVPFTTERVKAVLAA
ncbi:MAG TPA: molybdopterin cofactor-binding domain-containing protein [Castellaniella sp.]|uniref:xanthine dehydrogenase family protein molybdopterin-binding subunit n=1 Tax=Castellaniella sp. TaxID=1955812 RepID=UPI002F0A56E5